eukprot:symbB.v1.2.027351.t1/scaffold2783.1/size70499/4
MASAVGPPGTSSARPLSRQMSDSLTALTGFPEILDLERRIWQQAVGRQAGGSQSKHQEMPVAPPLETVGQSRIPQRKHPEMPVAPPLEVVGQSSLAIRSRPMTNGSKTRKSSANARPRSANAKAAAKPIESSAVRSRKECTCNFCPSCRRRRDKENVRQAIQRSLQSFGSDDVDPPGESGVPTRTGRGPSPGTSNALPRTRSSPAVRRPARAALSRGQSIERLRQHTRASIARVTSSGSRLMRNVNPA